MHSSRSVRSPRQWIRSCLSLGLGAFALGQPLLAATSQVLKLSPTGHDRFYSVAFDAKGGFYAVGSYADSADAKTLVAHFKADGSLDTQFAANAYTTPNVVAAGDVESARSVVVDSAGRVLVAGQVEHLGGNDARDRDIFVMRLLPSGQLDPSFGNKGTAVFNLSEGGADGSSYVADSIGGIALDASGRLLVHASQRRSGGVDSDFVLLRLTAAGQLDSSFATGGRFALDIDQLSASPKPPVVLADGRLIGVGYMRRDSLVVPVLYRLTANGQLDLSFGQSGIFSQSVLSAVTEVYAAVAQGNALVTVGYGKNAGESSLDFLSLRIDEKGQLDASYGTSGGYTRIDIDGFDDNGRSMNVLPDGRLLLVGGGRYSSANVDGMLSVLSANGIPDESFGEQGSQLFDFGGANDFLWGVAVSPIDSSVVAVGIKGTTDAGASDDAAIVRVEGLVK